MGDHNVMIKMMFSALAGFLFFVTAMFTTMLDLSLYWRNIWLGICLFFFVSSVIGVFYICGDLNSDHHAKEAKASKEA